jgi:SecD/SecF fusion protein
VASGAYSSIFIASPVLTHWKEREPAYRSRRARIEREVGMVPAYATDESGRPEDVEPTPSKRGRRRRTLSEEPGAQISRDEFRELVEDIQEDTGGAAEPVAPARRGRGRAPAAPTAAPPAPVEPEAPAEPDVERDPSADLTPEDLVLKDAPKPKTRRSGGRRNRRHGRSR